MRDYPTPDTKPIEKQIDRLEDRLSTAERRGSRAAYGDAEEICDETRQLWLEIRELFSDRAGFLSLHLGADPTPALAMERAPYSKTESVFHEARVLLQKSLKCMEKISANRLTNWQAEDVRKMVTNLQEWVAEMGIIMDEKMRYFEKFNVLVDWERKAVEAKIAEMDNPSAAAGMDSGRSVIQAGTDSDPSVQAGTDSDPSVQVVPTKAGGFVVS